MRIALDAMGTDQAPSVEIEGAIAALDLDPDLRIVLVGPTDQLRDEVRPLSESDRLSYRHAPDRITASDSPASAVRKKPDSSIAIGLQLQVDGEVDAFVSAGSTGAVMAGSLLRLRPLAGVDRPTVGTLLPTPAGPTLMLDSGANIDCKAHHLLQFARLGAIYMEDLQAVSRPRVGLLNVGSEPGKGTEVVQEAYGLLSQCGLNFVGNIEGRDVIRHACDVLVCDGFPGNVLLKFYESVAGYLIDHLRDRLKTDEQDEVFRSFDYSEYGGAPLLGVNGVTIICHGGSSPKAITNAIGVAAQAVRSEMVSHMARELSQETIA